MKQLTVIAAAILLFLACNNAADPEADGPDTSSSLPAPATVDTNSLRPDSPQVEKALRK
jgi:hypothetical protein